MGRPSKKCPEFGDAVLGFSRRDAEFEAERQKAKQIFEAKIRELDLKRKEQKKLYVERAEEYNAVYTDVIMQFMPKLLALFGIRLESDLEKILASQENIALLNQEGDYKVLFTKEVKVLEGLNNFFKNRDDILDEIIEFTGKEYAKLDSEHNAGN